MHMRIDRSLYISLMHGYIFDNANNFREHMYRSITMYLQHIQYSIQQKCMHMRIDRSLYISLMHGYIFDNANNFREHMYRSITMYLQHWP